MRLPWLLAATLLALAGGATLWFADALMRAALHLVGEQRALGAANVVRAEDGAVHLTNPGAMAMWTLPFLFLGALLLLASALVIHRWRRRQGRGTI